MWNRKNKRIIRKAIKSKRNSRTHYNKYEMQLMNRILNNNQNNHNKKIQNRSKKARITKQMIKYRQSRK